MKYEETFLKRKYSDNQKTMEQKDDIIAILKSLDVVTKQICLLVTQEKVLSSAQDPINFDADPDPGPGSALKKMDPDPGHFFKIY